MPPPTRLRSVPMVAPQQSDWTWDGSNWVCGCDGSVPIPPPCPPSGFPTPCPPWFPPPAGQAPWYPGANGGVSFSATPPANPIRGNFWWDGSMLHLFDGAAWVDIGPGSGGGTVVGTSPPSNPAVGATWWNGTAFQVWDGGSWKPSYGIGVTDGSNAAAGQVGEFVAFTQGVSSTTTSTAQLIVMGSLNPGDWDCSANCGSFSVAMSQVEMYLSPAPAGFTNGMTGFNVGGLAGTNWMSTTQARASLTAVTSIQFHLILVSATVGTASVTFSARRRR